MRTNKLARIPQTLDITCGAACFASLLQFFNRTSPGEMALALELETLKLGYTPPINIVTLARRYGFACEMHEDATINDLIRSCTEGTVNFVTWWDEDAGHYSLVKELNSKSIAPSIVLMDPWLAREGRDKVLPLTDFILHWQRRGSRFIAVTDKLDKTKRTRRIRRPIA